MYKYFSFSEYSLTNLLNDEIYMNHHESFNDPFECRCDVQTGFPLRDGGSSRLKDIIRAWGFEDENISDALQSYDDLAFSLEDTEPSIPHIIDGARISCFSQNADNLLMWSHYADGLRGFCIEFDSNLVLSKYIGDAFIYDVLYKNTPAKIDTAVMAVLNDQVDYNEDAIYASQQEMKHLGNDKQADIDMYEEYLLGVFKSNNEIYQKMLATKPLDWEYENERRIICQAKLPDERGEFLKYPPEAIKSVIFGEKMPVKQRDTLIGILEKHSSPVILKEAMRVEGTFNIVLNRYTKHTN
jgi:hypothetical protein